MFASIRADLLRDRCVIPARHFGDNEIRAYFEPRDWRVVPDQSIDPGETTLFHPVIGYWIFQSIDLDFEQEN